MHDSHAVHQFLGLDLGRDETSILRYWPDRLPRRLAMLHYTADPSVQAGLAPAGLGRGVDSA